MNLPIPTSAMLSSAVIGGATRIAGKLARGVSEAVGFDKVLQGAAEGDRGGGVKAADDLKTDDLKQQTAEFVHAIRQHLSRLGIAANQPLRVSVSQQGRVRVEGQHPRGAEIESVLNADPQLAQEAKRLHQAGGRPDIAIGLTIPGQTADPSDLTLRARPGNILPASGGYPNW